MPFPLRVNRKQFGVMLVCAAILAILLVRLHTFHEPLERDITTYAVIGHQMVQGQLLYSDLWDHKPPAIHVTFALGELIAGYGPGAIFLLNVTAALLTLAGLYASVAWAGGGYLARGLATLLWAFAGGDLHLQANQPNTEVFINLFLVWGVAFSLRIALSRLTWSQGLVTAVCWALASLYKMVVITVPAAIVPVVGLTLYRRGVRLPQITTYILLQVAIGVALWCLVAMYFFIPGRFDDFTMAVITFNRAYSVEFLKNIARLANPAIWSPLRQGTTILLAAGAAAGVAFLITRRCWTWLFFSFAYLAGAIVAVMLPGYYWPHYFQLLLPPLILLTVLGLAEPAQGTPLWQTLIRHGAIAALIAGIAFRALSQLSLPVEEWSRMKYGEVFVGSAKLGKWLQARTSPSDGIYEFGGETGLYFYSQRSPVSGLFYDFPLVTGPFRERYAKRVISEVMKRQPPVLLLNRRYLSAYTAKEWQKWPLSPWRDLYEFIGDKYTFVRFDQDSWPVAVFKSNDFTWRSPEAGP